MPRLAAVDEFVPKSHDVVKRMNQAQIEEERQRVAEYLSHQKFVLATVEENITRARVEAEILNDLIWPYYEAEMIAAGVPA